MKLIKQIFSFLSILWAWRFDSKAYREYRESKKFGEGRHDCALEALYSVVAEISEDDMIEAFTFCTENWPYAGVTNKEFNIVVKYLKLKVEYDDSEGQTIKSLTRKKTGSHIALLHGHYIVTENGQIIGRDANIYNNPGSKVYCSWRFL